MVHILVTVTPIYQAMQSCNRGPRKGALQRHVEIISSGENEIFSCDILGISRRGASERYPPASQADPFPPVTGRSDWCPVVTAR